MYVFIKIFTYMKGKVREVERKMFYAFTGSLFKLLLALSQAEARDLDSHSGLLYDGKDPNTEVIFCSHTH